MPLADVSDSELLRLIQQGNHPAFASLVERHTARFYRLSFRYTRQQTQAEDIVQDAFLKLWENPHIWQPELYETHGQTPKFTTWFYRIIANLCLDTLKKKQALPMEEGFDVEDSTKNQEQHFAEQEMQTQLEYQIAQLPDRQRLALNLCFEEGVSNREAAEIMGLNLKALESLLIRAKTTLKTKLNVRMRYAG